MSKKAQLMISVAMVKWFDVFTIRVDHLFLIDMYNLFKPMPGLLPVSFLSPSVLPPIPAIFSANYSHSEVSASRPRPVSCSKFGHFQSAPLSHAPDVVPGSQAITFANRWII